MLGVIGGAGLVGAVGVLVARERLSSSGDGDGAARRTAPPAAPPEGEATSTTEAEPEPVRWSDPAAWDGAVPGPADVALVERAVLLDVDAQVAGLRIAPQGTLIFDPEGSRRFESGGNVVVEGTLRMRPTSADVDHALVFPQVDEAAFAGGHAMEVVESDVGVWVTGRGVLDLAGTAKTAWARLAGPAEAGATTIEVDDATGWRVGDEIVVAPTEAPGVDEHWAHFDERTLTAVDGSRLTLDRPLSHPHPAVTLRQGLSLQAEVLNLSRNVRIEGVPGGRPHVMLLHVSRPQRVSHVALRHLGPRQGDDGVDGRYPLHFHMCEEGVRGSELEGVVGRECGNRTFVTHLSHGVTWRDCVSHNSIDDAFWWDPRPEDRSSAPPPTDDVVYDRCVAHATQPSPPTRYGTTGFFLGAGAGNVARGCLSIGVAGDSESSSGFAWPEHSGDQRNIWVFEDCLAHNVKGSGIYYWQNEVPRTIVDRFSVYHCGWGIIAGAYSNLASYRDDVVYACGEGGLVIQAVPEAEGPNDDETITYEGIYVDQAGLTDYAVEVGEHQVPSLGRTRVSGCTFKGGRLAQVGFTESPEVPQLYDFNDCVYEGNAFWLEDAQSGDTLIRVVDSVNGDLRLGPVDAPGQLREAWNARILAG